MGLEERRDQDSPPTHHHQEEEDGEEGGVSPGGSPGPDSDSDLIGADGDEDSIAKVSIYWSINQSISQLINLSIYLFRCVSSEGIGRPSHPSSWRSWRKRSLEPTTQTCLLGRSSPSRSDSRRPEYRYRLGVIFYTENCTYCVVYSQFNDFCVQTGTALEIAEHDVFFFSGYRARKKSANFEKEYLYWDFVAYFDIEKFFSSQDIYILYR